MKNELSIAFIGGDKRVPIRTGALAGKVCPAGAPHVIDINQDARAARQARGRNAAPNADKAPARRRVSAYALKRQGMKEVMACTRQWRRRDTQAAGAAMAAAARRLRELAVESGK